MLLIYENLFRIFRNLDFHRKMSAFSNTFPLTNLAGSVPSKKSQKWQSWAGGKCHKKRKVFIRTRFSQVRDLPSPRVTNFTKNQDFPQSSRLFNGSRRTITKSRCSLNGGMHLDFVIASLIPMRGAALRATLDC